jgi:hypothetical protein
MNKNTIAYIAIALALPVLTVVVWLIWVFVLPAFKNHFLNIVSSRVEKILYGEQKKRKTKGLRPATAKKGQK